MKGRKNPLNGTRVIGFVYINWKSEKIACDLYEGNKIVNPDGRVAKISDENYQKMYELYLLEVKAGNRIHTAAEANERMQVQDVPVYTADPQAAEKEYAMRETEKEEEITPEPEELSENLQEDIVVEREEADATKAAPKMEAEPEEAAIASRQRKGLKKKRPSKEPKSKEPSEEAVEKLPAEEGKTKRPSPRLSLIFLTVWLLFVSVALVWLFYLGYAEEGAFITAENTEETSTAASSDQSEYIVVALAEDIEMADAIAEDDIKGVIVSREQYESYQSATYVDEDGEVQDTSLILWEQRSEVIGKYAAADLKAGSLLYDTDFTSLHVVADKTYVEATINGEDGSYEVDTDSLSGNTKIQIVAVVTTDGEEPVQVLLTQMTLQDRSLESIFDAAGQDILEQLSGAAEEEETDEAAEAEE